MSHELPEDELNLLSIDNCGPDCITSILILDKLMRKLQEEDNLPSKPRVKKFFQMIVGTGTGGIIALMGGKLDMDTDDMMKEFGILGKNVFSEEKLAISDGLPNAHQYEKELREMVERHGGDEDRQLLDGQPETCLVAVTAMSPHNLDSGIPSVLRTYQATKDQSSNLTIWEAMCATSANRGLFKSMQIGPLAQRERFVDAGHSNPMAVLLSEAKSMFPDRHVSCIVSIGAGRESIMKMPDRDLVRPMLLPQPIGDMPTMTIDDERVTREMEMRFQDTENVLFRLDVERDTQGAKIDNWNWPSETVANTESNNQSKFANDQIGQAAASILAKNANVPTAQLGGKIQQAASTVSILQRCPESTKLFTGCTGKLKRIQKCLTGDPAKRKVFVVYGIAGAGKTQLVLEFARRSQDRFSEMLYIDASSQQNVSLSLKDIARLKNLKPTKDSALRWLADPSHDWLLIFDNVNDPSFKIQDYFPRCSHGSIAVITQNPDLQNLTEGSQACCQVEGLDPVNALELLIKAACLDESKVSNAEMSEASAIVKDLGNLALAIVQAGAYILRSRCSLAQYRQDYQHRRRELEHRRGTLPKLKDYQLTIYATWTLGLERLRPKAREFLQLLSLLHCDNISTSIFERAVQGAATYKPTFPTTPLEIDAFKDIARLLEWFSDDAGGWDLQKFLDVMSEIRSYSLIRYDRVNGSYSIPRLVQAWLRTVVHNKDSVGLSAMLLLALGTTQQHQTSTDDAFMRLLLPHFAKTRQHHDITANVAERFAVVYDKAGEWEQAARLYSNLVDLIRQGLGEEHSKTLMSMSNLASICFDQGLWQDAEKLQVEVIEFRKLVLGQAHPDTLSSMHDLALTYTSQGRREEAEKVKLEVLDLQNLAETYERLRRWEEAERLQAEAFDLQMRLLGQEDPHTLASIGNLIAAYLHQGRWKESEELGRKLLEIRTRVLGEAHPDTLAVRGNLAIAYTIQGRWEEAEKLQAEVLGIQRRVLGQEHPDTLATMNNLASAYYNQGRWDEAVKLLVETLEIQKQVLGEEHLDTLTSMHNLATNYSKQGRWREAEVLEVKVLALRRKLVGEENAETLVSMSSLATTYSRLGRVKEAEKLEVQVLDIQKRILGEDHPDTLSSMNDLASTYQHQGRWEEAERLQVKMLGLQKRVLGVEHPDTLRNMTNLCSTYLDKGQWKKAETLQAEALAIQKRVLGEGHPITLISMNNLASTYVNQNRSGEAEALQVKVVEAMKRVLGEDHPETLTATSNLAGTYLNQGRWEEAERLQIKVLGIQRRELGEAHPLTLTTMDNLGMTYYHLKQWRKAGRMQEEVVRGRKQVMGHDHPTTLESMHTLAFIYGNQRRFEDALKLLLQVHNERMRVLGPAHPDTQRSIAELEAMGIPRILGAGVFR